MVVVENYVLFWKGWLSQWHMSDMYDPMTNKTFNCAEQYMMYKKAELFEDGRAMSAIMAETHPRDHQAIGRLVHNYDEDTWNSVCRDVVAYGNYLKFSQNPELLKKLMKYTDHFFVEASPIDEKWGIGYSEDSTVATVITDENLSLWGKNWLGKAINKAQNRIINDQYYWMGETRA